MKAIVLTVVLLSFGMSVWAKRPPSKEERERRRQLLAQEAVEYKKWLGLTPEQEQKLKEIEEACRQQCRAVYARSLLLITVHSKDPYWDTSEVKTALYEQYSFDTAPCKRAHDKAESEVYTPEQREKRIAPNRLAIKERAKQVAEAEAFLGLTLEQQRARERMKEAFHKQFASMIARHLEELAPWPMEGKLKTDPAPEFNAIAKKQYREMRLFVAAHYKE